MIWVHRYEPVIGNPQMIHATVTDGSVTNDSTVKMKESAFNYKNCCGFTESKFVNCDVLLSKDVIRRNAKAKAVENQIFTCNAPERTR